MIPFLMTRESWCDDLFEYWEAQRGTREREFDQFEQVLAIRVADRVTWHERVVEFLRIKSG